MRWFPSWEWRVAPPCACRAAHAHAAPRTSIHAHMRMPHCACACRAAHAHPCAYRDTGGAESHSTCSSQERSVAHCSLSQGWTDGVEWSEAVPSCHTTSERHRCWLLLTAFCCRCFLFAAAAMSGSPRVQAPQVRSEGAARQRESATFGETHLRGPKSGSGSLQWAGGGPSPAL